MKNPPSKKKEDWLVEQFGYWCSYFGVHPYNVTYIFMEKDEGEKVMSVLDSYPYRKASLEVYPIFWQISEQKKKQAILHEVMHLVLWELTHYRLKADEIFSDMEERAVEALSMGIANLK